MIISIVLKDSFQENDILEIKGVKYTVSEIEPYTQNMDKLILTKYEK